MKNCPTCGQTKRKYFPDGGEVTKDDDDGSSNDDGGAPESDSSGGQDEGDDTPASPDAATSSSPALTDTSATAPSPATPAAAASPHYDDKGNEIPPPPADMTVSPGNDVNVVAGPRSIKDEVSEAKDFAKMNPKTFGQYFDNKNLPGKISTMFGLLLGGAGAGLAHQEPALLGVIEKDLQRDFQAQVNNQHNAQNWYTLGQQHMMQQAQMPGIKAHSQLELDNATMNRMRLATAFGVLPDTVNALPPLLRNNAMQTLNTIQQQTLQKNQQGNEQTQGKINLLQAVGRMDKPAPAPTGGSSVDREQLNNARMAGHVLQIPGKGLNESEYQKATEQGDFVDQNRAQYKSYIDSYNQLKGMANAGQTNKVAQGGAKVIGAISSALGHSGGAHAAGAGNDLLSDFQQKRNAMVKTLGLPEDVAEAMLPNSFDMGDDTLAAKLKKGTDYYENKEKGLGVLQHSGAMTPFPRQDMPTKKKSGKKAPSQVAPAQAAAAAMPTPMPTPQPTPFGG